jgi:hypothetical protein
MHNRKDEAVDIFLKVKWFLKTSNYLDQHLLAGIPKLRVPQNLYYCTNEAMFFTLYQIFFFHMYLFYIRSTRKQCKNVLWETMRRR